MSVPVGVLTIWLAFTAILFLAPLILGILTLRSNAVRTSGEGRVAPPAPLELLVPLKEVSSGQEQILESERDPANHMVDRLCQQHGHARKIISGLSTGCAQKNHNLIAGIQALRPETEIIVFCDSSNLAEPDWLLRFTEPLETGVSEVVSTFRAFDPKPETLGGVSQAIYGSFVLLLDVLRPKPWGGATAIRRETFEKLNVTAAWARTVVDDLILGNVLEGRRIGIRLDATNLLKSPLHNQSVAGFLSYLDRQILFPKFTNPGIWVVTLAAHMNVTLAVLVSVIVGLVLFPMGVVGPVIGWASYGYLGSLFLTALLLRTLNPFPVSVGNWLLSFLPSIFLIAFIFLRSVFRNYIVWHGRKYRAGFEGVVLEISSQDEGPRASP
ncbi:MAG: glycosyltransferase [Deltaproteobacteria bacterium]